MYAPRPIVYFGRFWCSTCRIGLMCGSLVFRMLKKPGGRLLTLQLFGICLMLCSRLPMPASG